MFVPVGPSNLEAFYTGGVGTLEATGLRLFFFCTNGGLLTLVLFAVS